ncbi:TetR family transcriptional regulator [Arcticibacter tournemirensis]|uniref:TetR/AcrR family transcriptional regulator n=1 Tax=Arcticibacter tournemirensis TaxID=699437 RepID=A0A5M9H7F3_9SPHI|nr:TetR/AcrR family transcriptional regulator [Arcticibacter tournemirensis]KAA8482872.1 TetR/AcrR family transcriptional regulator [Arcticibacter tournemirensis]TQM49749.1 TetR family transcriptional regulator [Arcticibacter tournemirensis]
MEDSRQYILKTAYQLFLQKSYKAVTFKELMQKTGFSKGAFYHYFQSKEHIFEAIIDCYLSIFASVDFGELSQVSLRRFINDYFKVLKKNQAKLSFVAPEGTDKGNHYLLIFEALRIIPDFKDKVHAYHKDEMNAWIDIIKAARAVGEIKSDISDRQLARLFINSSDGAVLRWMMSGQAGDVIKDIEEVWKNLYALLKA